MNINNTSKKHTLVIDGNFFFFKTLFVIPRENGKLLDSESSKATYIRKMALDFAAEIKKFKSIINRVVFTIDSSSWRKDFFPEANYKGQRTQDEDVNWNNFYKCIEIFTDIIKHKDVIVQKVQGAEGDDIIYAWASYLNYNGENAIIVSGDGDLTQLVRYNESTNCYTLFYTNTHKKLMGFPGFFDWLATKATNEQTYDIFNMEATMSSNKVQDLLNELVTKNDLKVSEVKCDDVAFIKVLHGDKGDNIDSAYWFTKNKRTYRITEKKAQKILEAFEAKYGNWKSIYWFEESYVEIIRDLIVSELKADKMTPKAILNNLKQNAMMIVLHAKSIPEPIQNEMYKHIEKMYEFRFGNFGGVMSQTKILEGTQYETNNNQIVPKQYDFFNSADTKDIDVKDILGDLF